MNTPDYQKRKEIAMGLFSDFKKDYPEYFEDDLKLQLPKVPPKLKNLDLSSKMMGQVPIDDLQKSVLCGTCISDSTLKIFENFREARIQNRHSCRQKEWFFWKWFVCLKKYTSENAIQFTYPDGYQKNTVSREPDEILGKLKIATLARSDLTSLYRVLYPGGKLEISRRWLNHMNDYFLMTIWCDDGSLYNKRQGCICFDSMPKKQQSIFLKYLRVVWGIRAHLHNTQEKMTNGQIRSRIFIRDQESLLTLLRIVAPIIPVREMLYKILFVPKNNADLLQRWASEVEELVMPKFRPYIEEEYRRIQLNYQNDQKMI